MLGWIQAAMQQNTIITVILGQTLVILALYGFILGMGLYIMCGLLSWGHYLQVIFYRT